MNMPIRSIDLFYALQVMSGRMDFKMVKEANNSIFKNASCEGDVQAMAENILFKAIVGHDFHDWNMTEVL